MVGGIEAAADMASGAVIAHAVDGRARGHGDGHGECLNCGAELVGPFCHSCGQVAHIHRTLGAIGHDILHGVFHFEGRTWHTLPLLAWKPGELTRRYVHGQRARFVSPLALFLFSVFLMFAIIHSIGGPFRDVNGRADREGDRQRRRDGEAENDRGERSCDAGEGAQHGTRIGQGRRRARQGAG